MNNKLNLINFLISLTLILSIGLIGGYTVGYYRATQKSFPEIKTVDEINPGVTTIKLMEVKNGNLIGKISGRKARLAYDAENITELEAEADFSIPLDQIQFKNYYITNDIPENTQFIASEKGKYYYSVFDKKAFNIVPKNRVYFGSKEEAEQRGYKAKP